MRTQGKVSLLVHPKVSIITGVMQITFNGVSENIIKELILSELLEIKGLSGKTGIAVAINHEVVPKSNWPEYILRDKDSVLVIKATQGG